MFQQSQDICDGSLQMVIVFQDHLERLKPRLSSCIGEKGTAAIFRGVLNRVSREHPVLKGVEINGAEIRLDRLLESAGMTEPAALCAGFLAFTESIIAILADLTGGILVDRIDPLFRQFRIQLEEF